MPHLATPHTAKIAVTFTASTEPVQCEMTFAIRDMTDGIFTDPLLTANNVWNAVLAQLVPSISAQVVFNGVVFEDVRAIPYSGADFAFSATPGTRSSTGVPLPTDVALAVKKLSANLGRSGRGRLFWPLWNSDELISADRTSAAAALVVTTALASFQTAVETGPPACEVGIISQQIGKVVRSAGLFEPIVSWAVADLNLDNQRRRLLGRGR